jgi:Fe-S-cluster containining protein
MKRASKSKVAIFQFDPDEDSDESDKNIKKKKSQKEKKATGKKRKIEAGSYGPDEFEVVELLDEDRITEREWVPVTKETRWKCMKCGWCCSQKTRINLTWKEFDRIQDKLTVKQVVLDEGSGMSHPVYAIKEHCERYDPKTHKCTIYKDRLYTCAAFPFMITEDDKLLHSRFCRGFGEGEVVNEGKMKAHIRKWRKRAGLRKL